MYNENNTIKTLSIMIDDNVGQRNNDITVGYISQLSPAVALSRDGLGKKLEISTTP